MASSLRHSIHLVQIQTKRNSAMTSPSREKYSTRANGKQIRTRSTGSIYPEHKTKDYNSGRRDLTPSTKWSLKKENGLYSKDSPRLHLRRRLYANVIGKCSSSSRTHWEVQLSQASGNRCEVFNHQPQQLSQHQQASGNRREEVLNQLTRKETKQQSLKSISELRELPKMWSWKMMKGWAK